MHHQSRVWLKHTAYLLGWFEFDDKERGTKTSQKYSSKTLYNYLEANWSNSFPHSPRNKNRQRGLSKSHNQRGQRMSTCAAISLHVKPVWMKWTVMKKSCESSILNMGSSSSDWIVASSCKLEDNWVFLNHQNNMDFSTVWTNMQQNTKSWDSK